MKWSHYIWHHGLLQPNLEAFAMHSRRKRKKRSRRKSLEYRGERKKGREKQRKRRKRMGRWKESRLLSGHVSDSFTNDLWMIYPWTCFCPSEPPRPLISSDAVSGDSVEPRLICHYYKADAQDGAKKAPLSCSMQASLRKTLRPRSRLIFLSLFAHKNKQSNRCNMDF